MPRLVRRVTIAAAVLTVLVVAVAIALPFLVDANRFRPRIAAQVKAVTGRDVKTGDISFRLLPAPGLSVAGPITLSDSAAYPGRDALKADSLSVRLSLPDLLRGRLTLTSFTVHKPTVTLIRDAHGRWNFEDLVERSRAASAAPGGAPAAGAGETGAFRVQTAALTAGRLVVYDDAVTPGRRQQMVIAPVDATVRGWGGAAPVELDLSAGIGKSVLTGTGQWRMAGENPRLNVRAHGSRLRAEDFAVLFPWVGVARPAGMKIDGAMDLDGSAEVPIERPETMRFKGSLVLQGMSYGDAGMALPLKDLSGTLSVDGNHAVWKGFQATAGKSSLRGEMQLEDFAHPRIGFDLSSPRLDLNELVATLSPATGTAPAGAAAASAPAPAGVGLLDDVRGSGRLQADAVRFQTFDLGRVRTGASLARRVFTLKDFAAEFYGGTLGGTASVDLAQTTPRYSLAARLDKVDVEPLLAAYDPALKGLLRGRFTGQLDLGAGGAALDHILKTAKGGGRIDIDDGVLTSFSVLKQLATLLEIAGGKGIGRDNTPFESLRGTLAIDQGRARTDDLALHSQDLDLSGKGWVGLDATLDLDIVARFSEESTSGMLAKNSRLSAFTENGRLVVYFGLQGNLASPTFRLNTRAQAGTATQKTREKIQEQLRDRLLKQLGQQPSPSPGPGRPGPSPAPSPTP